MGAGFSVYVDGGMNGWVDGGVGGWWGLGGYKMGLYGMMGWCWEGKGEDKRGGWGGGGGGILV